MKKAMIAGILAVSILVMEAFLMSVSRAWYDSSFNSRLNITVNNTANSMLLDNYPVMVNLSYANIASQSHCSDFKCIVFADSGDSAVPFYRNQTVTGQWAEFWLSIDTIPANGYARVFAYFNNTTAVTDIGTNPLNAWLNWSVNINEQPAGNGCSSGYCNVSFEQNDMGALVVMTLNFPGVATNAQATFELRNDSLGTYDGGGAGTSWLYTHELMAVAGSPVFKYFNGSYNTVFSFNTLGNTTFTWYANASYGPVNYTLNIQNDTSSINYSVPHISEGADGQSGNVKNIRQVATWKGGTEVYNLYMVKVRKLSMPEPSAQLFNVQIQCVLLATCLPIPIPAPSKYCANNYTLVATSPQLVFNGTAQQLQNITTINICDPGSLCRNFTFFGPSCDPPILQQPLWLIAGVIIAVSFIFIVAMIIKRV